jgi:hypothetical protein
MRNKQSQKKTEKKTRFSYQWIYRCLKEQYEIHTIRTNRNFLIFFLFQSFFRIKIKCDAVYYSKMHRFLLSLKEFEEDDNFLNYFHWISIEKRVKNIFSIEESTRNIKFVKWLIGKFKNKNVSCWRFIKIMVNP